MRGRHRLHRPTSSRRVVAVGAATAVVTSLGVVAGAGSPASAADPCFDPLVREVMVSQGLPSYDGLVRGKTTLVKGFLSEKLSDNKTCKVLSTATLFVTGGSVTISNGTTSTTLDVPATGQLSAIPAYTTAPATDSPSDALFTIPGSKLVPPASGSALTFTGTLQYKAVLDGTTTVLQTGSVPLVATGTTAPVTKALKPASRPLRVLVVPMGNTDSATPQFPDAALSTLQSALVATGRIMPVADGVEDIYSPTGGVRYRVAAGTVDLGPHDEVGATAPVDYMSSGRFCGTGSSFAYIRQKLSDFRAAWNAENPTAPADRVLGVVDQSISDGPSTGQTACAEGYAAVNGPEAWVRLVQPTSGASPSGATAALELNHTYGGVATTISKHSSSTAADGTAVDRGYNGLTRRYVSDDRSAMRFDVAGWTDYSVLYEKRDWDFTTCVLASTASPATECGSQTTGGTAPAAGAFVMSGLTDFTAAGTSAHTYFEPDAPVDGVDNGSDLKLVAISATGVRTVTGVRYTLANSQHVHEDGTVEGHSDGKALFDVALPGGKATTYELWKGVPGAAGSVRLFTRTGGADPQITAITNRVGPTLPSRYTNDGQSSRPSVAGDLVARSRAGVVALSTVGSSAVVASVAGQAGSLSADGATLTVTSDGDVLTYPLTRSGQAVVVGTPTTVYDSAGLLSPGAASDAVLTNAGAVFSAGGDLYAVDTASPLLPASSTLCGVTGLPVTLPGNPCRALTATPDTESGSAWSAERGLLAYTSTTAAGASSVWTLDPSVGTGQQRVPAASEPAWTTDQLLVSTSGGLVAVDGSTFGSPTTITTAPGDTQPAASGVTVLFQRPSGSSNDVWQLRLDRRSMVVDVVDENAAALVSDFYFVCEGIANPALAGVRPVSVSGQTARFEVVLDPSRSCASPVLRVRTSDGVNVTSRDTAPVAGRRPASAAIHAPLDGSTLLTYETLVLAGETTDSVEYRLTGPAGSGYSNTVVASSPIATVKPTTGFAPGLYTLALTTSGPAGSSTSTARFTVLADADGDGESDASEATRPCYPAGAAQDTRTATTDYDGDLRVGRDDPNPCVSSLNATIDFAADSINLEANGNTLTINVSTTALDVRKLTTATTQVSRLGGHPVAIPALSLTPKSASLVEIKFSRQAFASAYQSFGLTGYVPVLITGRVGSASFAGYDPDSPTYNP